MLALMTRYGVLEMLIKSLLCGAFVGFLFSAFKLPIPAPPTIEGVIGIIGVFIGYSIHNLAK